MKMHLSLRVLFALVAFALQLEANCDHSDAKKFSEAAPYAAMSSDVYGDERSIEKFPSDFGYNLETGPKEITSNGLAYSVYKHSESGEIVVAFRGTNNESKDWVSNVDNFFGMDLTQSQYDLAEAAMIGILIKYGKNVTVTGHSLGGGLATSVANRFGLKAFSFNGADVSSSRLDRDEATRKKFGPVGDPSIKNFYHEKDPLTNLQQSVSGRTRHIGEDTEISNKDLEFPWWSGLKERHSIDPLANFLGPFPDCFKDGNTPVPPSEPGDHSAPANPGGPLLPPSGETPDREGEARPPVSLDRFR